MLVRDADDMELLERIGGANSERLTIEKFARMFLCELSLNGTKRIDLGSGRTSESVDKLVHFFNQIILALRERDRTGAKSQLYYDIVALKNHLQRSETGACDGFEDLLSSQQTWLASKSNPSLTSLRIDVGEDVAIHTMQSENAIAQKIVSSAVAEYSSPWQQKVPLKWSLGVVVDEDIGALAYFLNSNNEIRSAINSAFDEIGFTKEFIAQRSKERELNRRKKTTLIKDMVWGMMEFLPQDMEIIDCPLLQRLRNIRQLGLTYQIYPSAEHTRFSHSLGVAHAANKYLTEIASAETVDRVKNSAKLQYANNELDVYNLSEGPEKRWLRDVVVHAALLHGTV